MTTQNTYTLITKLFKVTWKKVISNRFDSSAFRKTHADLYEQSTRQCYIVVDEDATEDDVLNTIRRAVEALEANLRAEFLTCFEASGKKAKRR